MNPEQTLQHIAELIERAQKIGCIAAHVCWFVGEIHVGPLMHTITEHHIFMRLNKEQLQNGLSTEDWHRLSAKIAVFMKEQEQCPQPQKR